MCKPDGSDGSVILAIHGFVRATDQDDADSQRRVMDQEGLGVFDKGLRGRIPSHRVEEKDHVMKILPHVTHHAGERRTKEILIEI